MFRGILLRVSRDMGNVARLHQSAGRYVKCNSALRTFLIAPNLPAHAPKLFIEQQCAESRTVRNFHQNCVLSFFKTPELKNDPCKPPSDECEQEQEEEECTITPCCKPFRLQKEHPMKKEKEKAECQKKAAAAAAEEKKPAGAAGK